MVIKSRDKTIIITCNNNKKKAKSLLTTKLQTNSPAN